MINDFLKNFELVILYVIRMSENHPLLKVLKEFDLNIFNIDTIDEITYKNYKEILFQYLNDIDPFKFHKWYNTYDVLKSYKFILCKFNNYICYDYFDNEKYLYIGSYGIHNTGNEIYRYIRMNVTPYPICCIGKYILN